MRRIAIALTLLALVVGLHACAADAPTRPPGGGGGGNSSALLVQLFTSDANPKAGTCTLIEALVSLNGNAVPDGTGVSFTTDFGTFSQNGLPTVSVVTSGGAAVTALCGPGAGQAKVKATATVSGKTNSATVTIVFQPDSGTLPFVSSCSPSVGATTGGDTITLNGGRFFGTTSTSRVQFTAGGITRDGIVTQVTANAVLVQTPQFPELTAPSTPAQITLTLGTNLPSPVVLSLPNCFTFGVAGSNIPTITAILPSSGTFDGNTRVTIIGSGFATTGVQVFFGSAEATVISTTFNQIVALSPKAPPGAGSTTGGGTVSPFPVPVTVKNISSGNVSAPVTFNYTTPIIITAWDNNIQPLGGPFVPVHIFGQGFQAPCAVDLAGFGAFVQSVSATEIVVIPGPAAPNGCTNITGPITVVNIDTADGTSNGVFTYQITKPAINGVTPGNSCPSGAPCDPNGGKGGGAVTIDGANFPTSLGNLDVKFGTQTAFVTSATPTQLMVTAPITALAAPTCTGGAVAGTPQLAGAVDVVVTNLTTSCSVTAAGAFQYIIPCVAPAGP